MDDNKFWLWFWVIAGLTACCIGTQIVVVHLEQNKHELRMAEQGYERVAEMLPGRVTPVYRWEKTTTP